MQPVDDTKATKQVGRRGPLRRTFRALTSPKALLSFTGFFVLAAVAGGAAMLLPPSDVAGDLPGDMALDSIATRSVKANRDLRVPDPEAIAAEQEAARAAVRPVYDFDYAAADRIGSNIELAFAYARTELEAALAARRPRTRRDPTPEELVQAATPSYLEFPKVLQGDVDETLYAELAAAKFSVELEKAVQTLATGALGEEVAETRRYLLAERDRGITIRAISRSVTRGERDARDVERIPDLAAIQADLLRIGHGVTVAPDSVSRLGRVATALPASLSPADRRTAAALASRLVKSNLSYNRPETDLRKEKAAADVKVPPILYAKGEKIIGDGERVQRRHLLVFRFVRDQAQTLDYVQVRAGAALFTVLLVVAVFRLARRTVRRFRPGKRDLVFLATALLGNLALLRVTLAAAESMRDRYPLLTTDVTTLLLPLAAGTMLVRLLRSGESSVVFALVFAPLAALQLSTNAPAAVGLVASVVAADRLGRRAGRGALPLAAIWSGLAAALTVCALALFGGRLLLTETALQVAAAVIGTGLLSPLAAALIAPLFEGLFGYTSESQLVRLGSLNHPVLKELIIKAPGTYHHSLIVGTLAEAAARKIGAHPLLAKVGGYYHDLGKADAPLMFGENQKSENKLEKLPPEGAAMVLHRHVSEGLARGHASRLPRVVLEFIAQHHGTRVAGGMHQKAKELAEREGRAPPAEEPFRYPGPKPRTREVGLVMLADAVEAASRGLGEATPERLQALVPKIVEPIVIEGQLDECDLTMAEIRQVIESFQETLVEVHGLSRVEPLPPPSRPPTLQAVPAEAEVRALRP